MKNHRTIVILVLVLVLMIIPLGGYGALANEPRPNETNGFDQAPRIAIISAFGAELEAFKAQATIQKDGCAQWTDCLHWHLERS